MFANIAGYKFARLTELQSLREQLLSVCKDHNLKGTILLSPEGINLFIAGTESDVSHLLEVIRQIPGLENFEAKLSLSDKKPFNRMLVRLKKEIIAFGVDGIDPVGHGSPKLPAKTLKTWLDEGRPVTLLDTRNDYEVKLGTFQNALPIGIDHFRDFPAAVRKLPDRMKDEPIVMFCTGGIRCEKAGPFMEKEGFRNIFQLDGGILKYFEECGGAHYNGECFVFDQRVGLDPNLQETDSTQCFHCLTPLTRIEQRDSRYVPGKSCPHCYQTPAEAQEDLLKRRNEAVRKATSPLPGSIRYDNFRPIQVPQESDGQTIVDALCRVVRHIGREEWSRECDRGLILSKSMEVVPADRQVRAGERYLHKIPDIVEPPVHPAIEIIHEDEAIIVVNKPAPLPMHAAGRFNKNTLNHILGLVYAPEKPRPAHRLDANTTGLVVLTKSRHFASRLQPQFAANKVQKRYLVRVAGHPVPEEFDCDASISHTPGEVGSRRIDEEGGLDARTVFRVLNRLEDGTSILEARPLTGRTNQIRLHLQHLGFAVQGDPVYLAGGELGFRQTLDPSEPPLCLHAWQIEFVHPQTRRQVTFTAPPPSWAVAESWKNAGA